ncbi:MAG: DUF115 domain-containing protein [Spirochaetales bacterium]|nr:MAG: DUF115 domain-containing protein [Spirochaetales bacterium]
MLDPALFERNMLAIASTHPVSSAERLRAAIADTRLGMDVARDGSPVPYMDYGGRRGYLHSRVDPAHEAERLAAQYDSSGFYVFLGLGAGYLARAILNADRLSRGIIVEYRAGTLRALLERLDLTRVLADRRLCLLVDPDPDELGRAIMERYVPAVSGDLITVPLASRVNAESERFQQAAGVVRSVLARVSDDYSVQAFFGKRWFANIVRNLRSAAGATPPVGPIREAAVTAAGPSLENSLEELAARPRGRFLIATDTSLCAITSGGIIPDAVVSIDCQHISYYHFMGGIPADVPLFLDLASPPTLARLVKQPYFFTSGHPLARYVASRLRAFPQLDTSGGNVTHAAVSLAEYLGASTVDVYGADFSYPLGKSYARGTYIYSYFDIRQSRTTPQEGLFADFLFRNQALKRQADDAKSFRYLTKPLEAYLERLERLAEGSATTIRRHRKQGAPSRTDYPGAVARAPAPARMGRMFAAGRSFQSPEKFLSSYLSDLQALPAPPRSGKASEAALYLDGLEAESRDVWTTLLPAVAAFRREAGAGPSSGKRVLSDTREWSVEVVREELKALS